MMLASRKSCPSDVSAEEWALAAPGLTLAREDAGQRVFPLRELLNGLRHVGRTGIPWRAMPVLVPGSGKARTGRLWILVRDERPWNSDAPPAAFHRYSADRKGIHAQPRRRATRPWSR